MINTKGTSLRSVRQEGADKTVTSWEELNVCSVVGIPQVVCPIGLNSAWSSGGVTEGPTESLLEDVHLSLRRTGSEPQQKAAWLKRSSLLTKEAQIIPWYHFPCQVADTSVGERGVRGTHAPLVEALVAATFRRKNYMLMINI